MRYELQLRYYHSNYPHETKWEAIQSWNNTPYGKKKSEEEFDRMSRVDKGRSYRLVFIEPVVTVIKEIG